MTASLRACLLAAITLSWADMGYGHLIMKSPVPYGTDTLNNSPLVDAAIGSSTSDFPCKQRAGVYKISQMNNMAVGESQTLSFTGSASHGGGTCQLAVSLDHEPTTNSTWKIIQVYEGGCPITAAGNAGTDTFTYKIPQNFPNGQATLAWTWYNRIGNREIYMNCAPITVTGGADNQDYYNTLPDMYIINLPSSQCSSVETTNQIIPNPGQFVLKGDTSDKLASATGPACAAAAAAQTQGVQGYQSAASNDGAAVATGSAAASGTTADATTTANNGQYTPPAAATTSALALSSTAISNALSVTVPSGFVTAISLTVTPPAGTSAAPVTASVPVASPGPALGTQPSSGPSNSNTTSSGAATSSGTDSGGAASGRASCPTDGALVCNGQTQFGLCNFGSVVWQAVAAGTVCENGSIQRRDRAEVEELDAREGAVPTKPKTGAHWRFRGGHVAASADAD